MKKYLLHIVLFSLFGSIIYTLGICVWGEIAPSSLQKNLNYRKGSTGHMYTRMQELPSFKDVDILFLGSSHTYRGFDTRIFKEAGYSTFNLGSSAQTPLQTELLLERYLDDLNPKLVVYEVYPSNFVSDGVESSLDVIANDYIDNRTIDMAFDQNHLKVYNTLIYGLYKQLCTPVDHFEEPIQKPMDKYVSGGFVERKITYHKYEDQNKKKWNFSGEQFQEFEEIIQLLKKREIDFLLTQAPLPSRRFNSYTNNNEYDEYMSSFGRYMNFNGHIALDDSLHFYDRHHLNQDGVELFNHAFIEWLEREL